MKPAPFSYEAPTTVEETLALLDQHGDEAKLLAGGQSLVPLMSLRLAYPAVLIDINRVHGLDALRVDDGALRVGTMVRERVAERSTEVARTAPLLSAALPHIGHVAIRSRGTVGGSLAHADPAAELPAVALVTDAVFVLRSSDGQREVAADDFFRGFFTTALEPTELLTEVRFPVAPFGTGAAFHETCRRHGDFAMVGAGVQVTVADGTITDARIGLIGVADRPVRASAAEAALVGRPAEGADGAEIGVLALEGVEPPSDLHASSAYRTHVGGVLVRRALEEAIDHATGADG